MCGTGHVAYSIVFKTNHYFTFFLSFLSIALVSIIFILAWRERLGDFFFHGKEEERTITYFKSSKLQGLWLAIGLVFGLHQGMTQQQQKLTKTQRMN